MPRTRIRVVISDEVKTRVERYIDAHGLKKDAFVDEALQYYLRALPELPPDTIISQKIEK